MRNLRVLADTLPIVAKALADNLGVQLMIGGSQAATDGKAVIIPALNPDDHEVAEMAYGYVAHEAGHIKHTDMECFDESRPFHKKLLNIMEDIRIEDLIMREFPGSKGDLDIVTKRLDGGQSLEGKHPASQLAMGIQLLGRARVLGQTIQSEADAAYNVLKGTLSSQKLTKLMGSISMITACKTTGEVVDLRDRVLSMLEKPDQPESPDIPEEPESNSDPETGNDSGEGDSSSDPDAADDSSDSADDGDGSSGAGETDGENAEASESGDESGKDVDAGGNESEAGADTSQNSAQGSGSAGDDAAMQDAAQSFMESALSATDSDLSDVVDHGEAMKALLESKADPYTNPGMALVGTASDGDKGLAEVVAGMAQEGMNGLRSVLNGLVQSSKHSQPYSNRTGNRIQSNRLSQVLVGETRIFRKQAERNDVNTAIDILVDLSGSMAQRAIEAQSVAYGLGKVLQSIRGVNPAISAFPCYERGMLAVKPLLRHGERIESAHGRFGMHAQGGTPLTQSVWTVAATLAMQKEPRKVMFIVTDGDPDCEASAKAIIDRCERAGIEMMAIAIGHSAPSIKTLFKKYRVIGTVSQLRQAMHEMILETLTRAA